MDFKKLLKKYCGYKHICIGIDDIFLFINWDTKKQFLIVFDKKDKIENSKIEKFWTKILLIEFIDRWFIVDGIEYYKCINDLYWKQYNFYKLFNE